MDYTEVLDGTMLDEEQFRYDDYYSGSSELGRTAVVQVDVDDGGAHAWIEAFIRGRWQVVELTPPSSEDEDETQDDFWSRFGRWLVGDDSGDTGTDTTGHSIFTWKCRVDNICSGGMYSICSALVCGTYSSQEDSSFCGLSQER